MTRMTSEDLGRLLKDHLTMEVHPASTDPDDDTMALTLFFGDEEIAVVNLPRWARG